MVITTVKWKKEKTMNKKSSAQLLVGAMNLLTVGGSFFAGHVVQASTTSEKIIQLNQASLKSIEGSWLDVPKVCKARGFNADPIVVEPIDNKSHVESIYESFEN